MKDYTQMANLKEMALINGKMGPFIKGNSKMESDMAMGSGHWENRDMKGSM